MPDLTTLENVKAWLRIASGDTNSDDLLKRLITAGSAYFASRCSRSALVGPAMVEEIRDGHYGQTRMTLFESPVSDVTSVELDGVAIQASSGPLAGGFGFDSEGVFLRQMCFSEGYSNVTINYTAGYDPDSPEAAEIEQAVIELVAYKYRSIMHEGEVSQTLGGGATQTISYSFSRQDVPPSVQIMINKFSRPMVFG